MNHETFKRIVVFFIVVGSTSLGLFLGLEISKKIEQYLAGI